MPTAKSKLKKRHAKKGRKEKNGPKGKSWGEVESKVSTSNGAAQTEDAEDFGEFIEVQQTDPVADVSP